MSGAVLFYLYAAVALAGAVVLVVARNLIHGAIGLFATMVAIGGLYLLLGSEFLAAMQLFVYGGAITILILFGLMLAGPAVREHRPPRAALIWAAGLVSAAFFAAVAAVLVRTGWAVTAPVVHDTESIATILFSRYVLPFEVAGMSLTIALIGSVVVAREDDVIAESLVEPADTAAETVGGEAA